jgi:hypothetical protein
VKQLISSGKRDPFSACTIKNLWVMGDFKGKRTLEVRLGLQRLRLDVPSR